MSLFTKHKHRLKDLIWVGIFFVTLAAITLPVIFLSIHFKFRVNMPCQATIAVITTLVVQLLRGEPLDLVTGRLNWNWLKYCCVGLIIGAALMFVPAVFLGFGGWVSWKVAGFKLSSIVEVTLLYIAVAVAEELLFRGFVFQRLIKSIGEWPAQIIIAGYFLLIHLNNPGMEGINKIFAVINIFSASIMFGLAVIRFQSLAVAVGIHLMANWVQGVLLGFAVSGISGSSFLAITSANGPVWLTGGQFGLEASLPGLACVIVVIIVLYRIKPSTKQSNLIKEKGIIVPKGIV